MSVRPATPADEQALRELWEEFEAEVPEPPGFEPEAWADEWALMRTVWSGGGIVLIAEDDDGAAGMLKARAIGARWHIGPVQVRPRARRKGVARALVATCAEAAREAGATYVSLDVLTSNTVAASVWRALGFEPIVVMMGQPVASLEARLADPPSGASIASTHVQTDDRLSVDRALAGFVPRIVDADVRDAANGWIRIAAPVLDDDRDAQSRLAQDLSERLGGVVVALALERGAVVRFRLYERGLMVDEYLSVPLYYGELPRVDELALEANPTLVSRLTGADRGEVRSTIRTASTTAGLPPADTLYEQVARVMGLEP